MEFLDEFESKPRFVLQSKHLPQQQDLDSSSPFSSLSKPALIISLSFSLFTFILAFFYFNFDPLSSLLLWLSLSFLIGPFAPPSLTAGDIRVGLGPPLKEIPKISNEINEKPNRKSSKTLKKASEGAVKLDGHSEKSSSVAENKRDGSNRVLNETKSEEQSEWGEADEELLKKLMGKHPPGKPGRWEAIAEGFKGKHKVETVIAKAKETGDKKGSDQDSYRKFLKDRKPVDKRALDEEEDETIADENVEEGKKVTGWTSAEDLALLSALKAFPKDVSMRWEKIAASLPGKTKSACMKRVVELKKDFRSSKASPGQAS
ncbi:hypothetical protein ACS0TY_001491 [Phlomoides rotata]